MIWPWSDNTGGWTYLTTRMKGVLVYLLNYQEEQWVFPPKASVTLRPLANAGLIIWKNLMIAGSASRWGPHRASLTPDGYHAACRILLNRQLATRPRRRVRDILKGAR